MLLHHSYTPAALTGLLAAPSATAAASASAPLRAAAAQLPGWGEHGREVGREPGMGQFAAPVTENKQEERTSQSADGDAATRPQQNMEP